MSLATVRTRLRDIELADIVPDTSNSTVNTNLSLINASGQFTNLTYPNDIGTHTSRIRRIAAAYVTPGYDAYRLASAKTKIYNAINYYRINDPQDPSGWFVNGVSAPQNIGRALLSMNTGDSWGFDSSELSLLGDSINWLAASVAEYGGIDKDSADFVNFVLISLYKGCAKADTSNFATDFAAAFNEARVFRFADHGIKEDRAFYQHGELLHIVGYGMDLFNGVSTCINVSRGTTWDSDPIVIANFIDAVISGFSWFAYKTRFDFNCAGRHVANKLSGAPNITTDFFVEVLTLLTFSNTYRQTELLAILDHVNGSVAASPVIGAKVFFNNDIVIKRKSDMYFSARVPSRRVVASEMINTENLRLEGLPWGSSFLKLTGAEFDDIQPAMDWTRIAGVTWFLGRADSIPGSYAPRNTKEYCGGVDNGVNAVGVFDMGFKGLSAEKFYFMTDEGIFCMGAGITDTLSALPVVTAVEQKKSAANCSYRNATEQTLDNTMISALTDVQWVHHANVGYLFPILGNLTIKNENQTGNWNTVNGSLSSESSTQKIFSLWLTHGVNPTNAAYQYLIVPNISLVNIRTYVNPFVVISNTVTFQAVRLRTELYALAFYIPGTYTIEPGLVFSTSTGGLFLIEINVARSIFKVSVSDPSGLLKDLDFEISKQLYGAGTIYSTAKSTYVKVAAPLGNRITSSLTFELATVV